MGRPTCLYIDAEALQHNLACIKRHAPKQSITAMIKSNAYGCGWQWVLPILEPLVDSFGVACLEEARAVRQYCTQRECCLMQGIFSADELADVVDMHLSMVVHNPQQLAWLVAAPLPHKIKIWVKVDTGMHRLGFHPRELEGILMTLRACAWVHPNIGLMTHLACADTPQHELCQKQLQIWDSIAKQYSDMPQSVANSAAILGLPQTHADNVRPGLIIFGASPFAERGTSELDLHPVMHFTSTITTIHQCDSGDAIGYGAIWRCKRPSVIGVVPVGYGDGYPRHIKENTPVWVNGQEVPIVGRVSMDMLTIDLTDSPSAKIGDKVELWGSHIPIETVAQQANTLAYELMTQVTPRVMRQYLQR